MGWRDLIQTKDESQVFPWVGGRELRHGQRTWHIKGKLPTEPGWYFFSLQNRNAVLQGNDEVAPSGFLDYQVKGYLVGDCLVRDDANVDPSPEKIAEFAERVFLIEPGLDRFARIEAGRTCESGHLIYNGQTMPMGPEQEVMQAFLDGKESLAEIRGVVPALDAAFRMEVWQKKEAEKRRIEAERRRKEEDEKRQKEEKRRALVEKLGDGVGRREMAVLDFGEAARAALLVGGAQYLDHRPAVRKNEIAVKFQLGDRKFECTCDKKTLQIIDSGICLTDHRTNEKGDSYFTLESFPGVIREAQAKGKLVVYRHVDGVRDYDDREDNEDFEDDY